MNSPPPKNLPSAGRVRPGAAFAVDAIARSAKEHHAIDLGLGAPDYPPPPEVIEAAAAAVRSGHFGYPDPWGTLALRQAVADSLRRHRDLDVDPATEITITCGATEAFYLALAVTVSPGAEVICFDPAYEGFAPAVIACGAVPRFVRLQRPSSLSLASAKRAGEKENAPWSFDPAELKGLCNSRTQAVLLNTPHNPTGKVFTPAELQQVADLCLEHGLVCICDEIYEHLVFDGRRHVSMMQIDGMRERTFLVSGLSKAFAIPGWRLGYVVATPPLTAVVRAMNDLVAGGVAAPLQEAAVTALRLPDSYFATLRRDHERHRAQLHDALTTAGLACCWPEGAWYLLTDYRSLGFAGSDHDFIHHLIRDVGVAAAPGTRFFTAEGQDLVRFCFGKSDALLAAAVERLGRLKEL